MAAIRSRIEWFSQLSTADAPTVTEETKFQRKVRRLAPHRCPHSALTSPTDLHHRDHWCAICVMSTAISCLNATELQGRMLTPLRNSRNCAGLV